jgi:hypothetical protein
MSSAEGCSANPPISETGKTIPDIDIAFDIGKPNVPMKQHCHLSKSDVYLLHQNKLNA